MIKEVNKTIEYIKEGKYVKIGKGTRIFEQDKVDIKDVYSLIIGENCKITKATFLGRVNISYGCLLKEGVIIGDSDIGQKVHVDANSRIYDSDVGDFSSFGMGFSGRGFKAGRRCYAYTDVNIFKGARILGDVIMHNRVHIGENAVIFPGARIKNDIPANSLIYPGSEDAKKYKVSFKRDLWIDLISIGDLEAAIKEKSITSVSVFDIKKIYKNRFTYNLALDRNDKAIKDMERDILQFNSGKSIELDKLTA